MNETLPEYNQMIRKSKQEGYEIGIKEVNEKIINEISKNPNITIDDIKKLLENKLKKY